LTWVQHSNNFDGSLSGMAQGIWKYSTNQLELLIGIWNAVVVNPAQGYLLEFRDKHKEQSINWGSTDSSPWLPAKHLLAKLNPQPVLIVVMWMRRLNIYCCSAQNGQQNASVTSVIRLTSQMCSRTMKVWWNSSSLRDICPSYRQRLTGSSWQQQQLTYLLTYCFWCVWLFYGLSAALYYS